MTDAEERSDEGDAEVVRGVGLRVRTLRESASLTQEELGARSNLTPKFISKVENGHANPSIGVVTRLCAGLGVPLAIFFAADPDSDFEQDLAAIAQLLSGASPEARAQALRVLRALLGK